MNAAVRLEPSVGKGSGVVADAKRPRILLVDDDRMLLRVLAEVIERRLPEAIVEACASPLDALRAIEARDLDIVISDLMMSGLTGLELLGRARALRPTTLVILITGAAERDLSVRALRGGAYDFISKPVDPDYLVACVQRAIETRALRAEVDRQQAALRRHTEELEETVAERTEELRRASRAKDEFLATISHELRTPLTAILGWARLLVSGKLDASEEAQAIESIARNARSQSQLIDDLLDVSRIVTGKMRLEIREADLGALIEAAIGAVLPAAQAKGITIESQLEPLDRVSVDPSRMQQVLWNLLANAVKFTPAGGRVAIRGRKAGSAVEIEVTDNGAGIEPGFLPFVFDRFRQGAGQLSSRRGLGLGLAIVRHLVELHGGSVAAESAGAGLGATFRVTLACRPDAASPRREHRSSASSNADLAGDECLRGVRVLVVDDEADTRSVLRLVLGHAGADVEVAASADEARAAVARRPPDLLLCDIGLGSEDGYSLLHTLRAMPGVTAAMRAVALTAHARSEDRSHALEAGFELHIAKPGPADLPGVLARVLASSAEPGDEARAHPPQRREEA
jgi:signal transduction histidine kinase